MVRDYVNPAGDLRIVSELDVQLGTKLLLGRLSIIVYESNNGAQVIAEDLANLSSLMKIFLICHVNLRKHKIIAIKMCRIAR